MRLLQPYLAPGDILLAVGFLSSQCGRPLRLEPLRDVVVESGVQHKADDTRPIGHGGL